MTEFSLNIAFKNLIKPTLTDQTQQKQMKEMTIVLKKFTTNQQKPQIFFKIITLSRRDFFLSLIQP